MKVPCFAPYPMSKLTIQVPDTGLDAVDRSFLNRSTLTLQGYFFTEVVVTEWGSTSRSDQLVLSENWKFVCAEVFEPTEFKRKIWDMIYD